jgi:hypothetical protein
LFISFTFDENIDIFMKINEIEKITLELKEMQFRQLECDGCQNESDILKIKLEMEK